MARATRTRLYAIPVAAGIKVLERNADRVMYSIQNLDAAAYVALAAHSQVTAGVFGANEGQHLLAGQSVSDTDDRDEVWIIASGLAAVNVVVQETVETSDAPIVPEELEQRTGIPHSARAALRPMSRQVY